MKICIVCKKKVYNSKYKIYSRGHDYELFSENCVKKFLENPDKYLNPVDVNNDYINSKTNAMNEKKNDRQFKLSLFP